RGQKNRIRAMFFAEELTRGASRLRMDVILPEGGRVAKGLAELYGPAETETWLDQAIDPAQAFIDLSGMNEKPAGRRGFVKAVGDRFEFDDGTPARFWGCNVQAYSLFVKDRQQIKRHAERIARLGFNLVRLHHHDSAEWVQPSLIADGTTSQQINEESLDAYFWWIKCLKDEGIYIWVDLMVGRPFREGDQIPGWSDLAKQERRRGAEAKGFCYLNGRVQELLKRFNEELLTRTNPHTGLALKDEPAVMGMLITNENDLTHHFGNQFLGDKGHPYHQKLFEATRDAFSTRYDLDRNRTGQTWVPGPSKLLLNDLEAAFNADFLKHLRRLGVRVPVATCHMWGHTPLFSLPALTTGEIIDSHSYSHGEFLRSNPHYVPSFIHWIGHAQVVGKPFAVTEYNMEDNMSLNDAFTVPLYMGAMAAFQGWDAPMLYGYSQDGLGGTATSAWSSYMHPAIMGLMPAAAVMFRQGHVQPARKTVVLSPTPDGLFGAAHTPKTSRAIRTAFEQHRLVVAMPRTTELPWLQASPAQPGATVVTDLSQDLLTDGQRFVESDTGEIRRDWEKGIQTMDTPKSQAAIGWLKGESVRLADTAFRINTAKAAVVLTSLDDQPLRRSQRILLSTAARVRKQKVDWRRSYRSEPVTGELRLTSSVSGLRLVALKPDGTHGSVTMLDVKNGVYTVELAERAQTHWFLITR
ncbi:MAG: glycosyl hydrolase family 5, partial [Lentisphaerae bacterium]|nr:glycosyl hydrolase family 5 [Lentisphaerota bacterium]